MKTYLGLTGLGHDASAALVREDGEILFAGHAERYSRVKNDGDIDLSLLHDAYIYGAPDEVIWYERPNVKALRWIRAGQWSEFKTTPVKWYIDKFYLESLPVRFVSHHKSHAAGGYFTSGFDEAAILVCDAIGELTTISAWGGHGNKLKKIWSQSYPHSLGLLYSAFTQRIGFKPNEEEYILMGMAALGEPIYADLIRQDFIGKSSAPNLRLKHNVHRGIRWWFENLSEQDYPHVAASIQKVTEEYLIDLVHWLADKTKSPNLVMMGGVALNCVANSKIAEQQLFENIWIMPNPGDAGSALGAVAAHLKRPLNWRSPYLGYDIPKRLNYKGALAALEAGKVIGIANGRAEFGPRALGNRSLICDPRGPDMKDRVNQIKKREPFRPFAPIIMEEFAHDYFEMPVKTSPYMQFVARVRHPELFPAITHYDGTARVQTLTRQQNPVFYELLVRWYARTGCPLLLNTSLNVKGEPLVNTWEDAMRFEKKYGVKIF